MLFKEFILLDIWKAGCDLFFRQNMSFRYSPPQIKNLEKDIRQEVMLRLLKDSRNILMMDQPKQYVKQMTKNVFREVIRKERRYKKTLDEKMEQIDRHEKIRMFRIEIDQILQNMPLLQTYATALTHHKNIKSKETQDALMELGHIVPKKPFLLQTIKRSPQFKQEVKDFKKAINHLL